MDVSLLDDHRSVTELIDRLGEIVGLAYGGWWEMHSYGWRARGESVAGQPWEVQVCFNERTRDCTEWRTWAFRSPDLRLALLEAVAHVENPANGWMEDER